jgi:MoaA/NifB/PqqE/SkfB family radical SAM enzyme
MHVPSLDTARRIFKKVRQGVDAILFTGPDPTVNPLLARYLMCASQMGYKNLRLVTNGRMLHYFDYARSLLKSGLTEINVSLHGSKPSVHDALSRTAHSFEETLEGCKNLMKLKSSFDFKWYVNFTLTSLNKEDLYHFLELVRSFEKVDKVIINSVIPQSRALLFFDRLIFSYKEHAVCFINAVKKFRKKYPLVKKDFVTVLGLPFCLLKGDEDFLSHYETILMNSRTRAVTIKEGRRYPKQKSKFCLKCRYNTICGGVWESYIKKRGFLEFNPVF